MSEPPAREGLALWALTVTLPELAQAFALRRELSPSSLAQYHSAVSCLGRFLGRPATNADLSDDTINRWLLSLESRLSGATRKSRRTHIMALWRSATRLGVAQPPGEIRRVKVPPRVPRAWTVEEMRRLLASVGKVKSTVGIGLPLSKKLELLIRLGWDSGARWGDVRTFKHQDLSDDGILPFVQHKTSRLHVAKFHQSTMNALGEFRSRSWLADWEYTHEYFRIAFGWLVKAAGVQGSFKWIRRSSGTNVEQHYPGAGAAHLGHGPTIAVNHYFDARLIARTRPMPEDLGP